MLVSPVDAPDASGVGVAVTRIVRTANAIGAIAASARFDRETPVAARIRARAIRAQVAARDILGLHGIELRVSGGPIREPAIYVANHLSYLDPLVALSLVNGVAIAKADVGAWPIIGPRLRDLGVIFVRRGDAWSGARALREAAEAIASGVGVLNFPEGTTSDGRNVLPFRRGVFGLARSLGVPIVPVRIAYDDARVAWIDDDAFLPHYAWLAQTRGIVARVRFGAPFAATGAAEVVAERTRQLIHRLTNN